MNYFELSKRPQFLTLFDSWKHLEGERVGITGSRGILGSLVSARLSQHHVTVLPFTGDVTNENSVKTWCEAVKPTAIIHLAALVPIDKVMMDPVKAMRVNGVALQYLCEAIASYVPNCWLFLSSSSHVYQAGNITAKTHRLSEKSLTGPSTYYGSTKLVAETLTASLGSMLGIRYCIGRVFSFYHERQPTNFLVPGLVARIGAADIGDVIPVRNPRSVRDFLYADAVVDAILYLYASRTIGIVNIGSGHGISVGDIARAVSIGLGKQISFRSVSDGADSCIVANVSLLRSVIKMTRERNAT